MDENVIKQIAAEVKKRLEAIAASQDSVAVEPSKTLLCAYLSPSEKENLSKELGGEWQIVEAGPDSTQGERCDAMIVGYTSLKDLPALAQCIPTDSITASALAAFFAGKKVILLEEGLEYRKWKETCGSSLYKRYQTYEGMIFQWGGTVAPISCVTEILGGSSPKSSTVLSSTESTCGISTKDDQCCKSTLLTSKKLITERDMAFYVGERVDTLKILPKAILTSLAADMARAKGITLVRCKEGETK